MASPVARIGALAGWVSLVGIFGYHFLLQGLFGPRVSGTLDGAEISAFYSAGSVAWLGIEQFVVVVPVLVFAVALREVLMSAPMARFWATVGLAVMTADAALIITEVSIQAAIVTAVSTRSDPVVLFRFWDVLYNSGVYVLESSFLLSFGLAFRASDSIPTWLTGLSYVAGAAVAINVVAIWVGIPDPATLPANMLFGAWFAATSVVLGRLASGHLRAQMVEGSAPAA